ncbi:MAG: division/cell wall cluster transcriptional repressor MraZ [Saprospiraceae bacterium]|nr:division/cell wall cluster transcriptional repressor MraZ [Saprospiraceae bacterium]
MQLIGEYECAIDAKGRIKLPTALLKQLGASSSYLFTINRGFEKCLILYPKVIWDGIVEEINQLNLFNKKNRDFVRYFYRGATPVETDSSERILLSKNLMDYAALEKDAVLFAYKDRIEIWAQKEYQSVLNDEPDDFSDLAEEVLGNLSQKPKFLKDE